MSAISELEPGGGAADGSPVGTFTLESVDGAARSGVWQLSHGSVRTPAFMPVGTLGP